MFQLTRRNREYLLLTAVILASVAACVSTGTPKLSKAAVEKVVEGETTKDEIIHLLDKPEQMLKLDKESLENYIRRVSSEKPPDLVFLEGQYEVWTYSKWSSFSGPVFLPGQENAKFCIFIINSDGICLKKLFAKEGRIGF
jgi:hypothetical protein